MASLQNGDVHWLAQPDEVTRATAVEKLGVGRQSRGKAQCMSQRNIPFEALARYAVERSPDNIVFADREGTIRLWNGSAKRIFGYPADEALGNILDLIVPERFREAHWRLKTRQERPLGKPLGPLTPKEAPCAFPSS